MSDIKFEIKEELGVLSENAKGWRKEVPPGIFGLDHSLNELHDYN